MIHAFKQIDVFGSERLGGNPVAVILDADELDGEEMQRLARWTNLSETTFVTAPSDPSRADYAVRIFTPSVELPFAGHPTLGTCHAWLEHNGHCRERKLLRQECAAGIVDIRRGRDGLAFAAPPMDRYGPLDDETLAFAADSLGVERAAVVDAHWVDNGPGCLALLLDSAERVLAIDSPSFCDLDIGVAGLYEGGATPAVEVRAFFPVAGSMREDPVTGSLNASLGRWLLDSGRVAGSYVASQGTALGRSGRVRIDPEGERIWVGGATRTYVDGSIDL
ncbi:PhzF family phenazine biosynthesis protein [Thermoleophilia bacterium SCSIO 60948]|nr:PhzF family phenazine biosynthesis protein [Thermoleophilia bacterium SCSIO 60948]